MARGGSAPGAHPAEPTTRAPAPPRGGAAAARLPSRRAILVAGSALFGVLAVLLFDPRLFTGGDNAVYYLLAKALATGRGYVTLYEPGEPAHALYPPGYPAMLVPVFWLFAGSFWAGKVLSLLAGAVAFWLAGRYLDRRLEHDRAGTFALAAAVGLLAVNGTFLAYSHWMLSEVPFLAVSLGALLLVETGRSSVRTWLPAALLAALAYLIRTAGLPLCIAVTWGVWRRHGRRAGLWTAAISVAAVGGWALRNAIVAPDAAGYLSQFVAVDPYDPSRGTLTLATFAARAWENAAAYAFLELPRLVWPFLPSWGGLSSPVGYVLGAALLPLVVYGAARQIARGGVRAAEVYVALYAGVLAAWFWRGDRFLLPIVPLLLGYLADGVAGLAAPRRGRGRARRRGSVKPSPERSLPAAVAALGTTLVLAPNLWFAVERVPGQLAVTARHLRGERLAGYSAPERDYFAAAQWLGAHAPEDAVVVSRKPQFTYLFSRRNSLLYPYAPPGEIEEAVRRSGATHLIFDRLGNSALVYLVPYLERYGGEYVVAHREGDPPTLVLARDGR